MRAAWWMVGLILTLGGCQKAAAPPAAPPTSAPSAARNAPAGVDWSTGGVEAAFTTAAQVNRPVLLYWGASWCPFCHTLKSKVFSRPDFIAKTRLFVPVYLDGDDPGAQKWAEQFGVQGYPTLVVLDPMRHEIVRVGAGLDVEQYAAVLDSALENVQPVDALLQAATQGKMLTLNECRRLAYNSWGLDTLTPSEYGARADALNAAATQCPADAAGERADLTIYAAYYAADADSKRLTPRLKTLTDQVAAIVARTDLATGQVEALQSLDDSFFKAVQARGQAFTNVFRGQYLRIMDTAAVDSHYVLADQLGFVDAKVHAQVALGGSKYQLPSEVVMSAEQRIDMALSGEQDNYVRPGLVNASLNILEDLRDYPKAYQIVKDEIPRADSPYYFQGDLADIAEQMGRKQEALQLFQSAYDGSKGAATRFQWGQRYVSGLLRLDPKDSSRIQSAGEQVLGELDGPDRIYRRARVRLEKLDTDLRAWNKAAKGGHDDVIKQLRARMQQICVKIPDSEPARGSCDAFLKGAA